MYAVIDLETTGGSAGKDRITEIAIVVHDGQKILREFSTLINPERSIPGYITDITGISNDMVASAPKFYEVAREVVELTEGCIFVAHNVNFDYNFLREEFSRLAYNYDREKLCTVRMSRSLIPGLPSYSLGKLCQFLHIPILARHRAKGDVDATVLVLERLLTISPNLGKAERKPAKDPFADLPSSIDRKSLRLLPEDPGLYFFHDPTGNVLHVNASRNIRASALKELLQLAKGKSKSALKATEIAEVSWELTGNELLATLKLEEEAKKITPRGPTAKEKTISKFGVYSYLDQRGYQRLFVDKIQKGKFTAGFFTTEEDARAALEARLKKYQLCAQLGGLEAGSGPCTWHDGSNQGCQGACLGLEPSEMYNDRLGTAIQGIGYPYPAFFLIGDGRRHDEIAVIGIEHGHLIGFTYLDESLSWDDPISVKGLLKPIPNSENNGLVLRKFLANNLRARMIPF